VTRIHSNDNIPPQTTTTSTDDPQITVEPTTPNPTGGDIQEIVHQSLIKTHSALARLRQPNYPWGQPLDFSDIKEQLGDIKLPKETLNNVTKPSPALSKPGQSSCDQCDLWLERYYIDIPILQSKIQSLEIQDAVLTSQRDKLQATDKKQKTTGSIVFKNVESATAFINSKLS
jgi:hypothetical protein